MEVRSKKPVFQVGRFAGFCPKIRFPLLRKTHFSRSPGAFRKIRDRILKALNVLSQMSIGLWGRFPAVFLLEHNRKISKCSQIWHTWPRYCILRSEYGPGCRMFGHRNKIKSCSQSKIFQPDMPKGLSGAHEKPQHPSPLTAPVIRIFVCASALKNHLWGFWDIPADCKQKVRC